MAWTAFALDSWWWPCKDTHRPKPRAITFLIDCRAPYRRCFTRATSASPSQRSRAGRFVFRFLLPVVLRFVFFASLANPSSYIRQAVVPTQFVKLRRFSPSHATMRSAFFFPPAREIEAPVPKRTILRQAPPLSHASHACRVAETFRRRGRSIRLRRNRPSPRLGRGFSLSNEKAWSRRAHV